MEPNGASDLIYDDAPFNQSFSIDVVSSLSLNEATEIMIKVYSFDTGDELGQFYYDVVDGQVVYDLGNIYLSN